MAIQRPHIPLPPTLLALALTACATTQPAPNAAPAPDAPPEGVEEAAAGAARPAPQPGPDARSEADLLSDTRQLVFAGKRSGEGYFSADGQSIIFQSEREPDNPFYQIYLLSLATGDTTRVSPGIGKTSCSWIHPDGHRALFASTHEDPDARAEMQAELDFRASGQSRRYSWDYDPWFDIYATELGSDEYVNLTSAMGYDAEGSYSPDGRYIAFASNRRAYSEPMTDEEEAAFERDPAFMMDIYLMDADGADVRRLTDAPGYDGGPFFSPDGQRITWRRFSPDGHTAEIWTMDVNGGDPRQLTHLGAMSWAPYYHPSGDYLIFATNLHGFQNFELYLVDAAGEREPVRVTFTDGWDGLPVFSPSGDQLVWSSGRTADKKAQLFTARWDDAEARTLLNMAPRAGEVRYQAVGGEVPVDLGQTSAAITAEDARLYVSTLAADTMDGRLTGTPGEAMATSWVARTFETLGLTPAGSEGFYQPFHFTSGVSLEGPNVLSVQRSGAEKVRPELDVEWRPLAFSKPGSVGFAPVVFAGYGIVAPAQGDDAAYDAYGDLDVKGKWVMVLRYLPEDVSPERRQHLSRYASLRFKAMEARDRGAVGLIVVSGPASKVKEELVPLRFDASVAGTSITAVSVTDALAQGWLGADRDLAALQAELNSGEVRPGFALEGVEIGGHLSLTFTESAGRNVLGRLVVGDAPSEEVVVIGAHLDHLGHGTHGDSLAKGDEVGGIHHGADDNASGVAGLIEIAQQLSAAQAAGELAGARRDVIFAAWSGEELGLLGSSHFVKSIDGMEDAADLHPLIAAYLNMDMIGRLDGSLALQGIGSSPFWPGEIEKRNVVVGLPLTLTDDTFLPTDATSFYLKGVPILAAFTGAHADYHTPGDTADKINYDSLARTARLMGMITRSLMSADEAPAYVKQAPKAQGANRRLGRAYLGTIPDYADTDVAGVKFSGTSEGGPAQAAGIEGGDILVELAGRTIENIYDYVRVLDALKVDEPVKMVVMRGSQRVEVTVTPGSRD